MPPAADDRSPGLGRLASCWALLGGVAVLTLRGDPGRALFALLWLAAVAFPALWLATTPARRGWTQRASELGVGLLVVAPLVALVLPWSPARPAALGACVAGLLACWVAVGVWLRGLDASEQGTALGWAFGLGGGVPLAQRLLNEATGWSPRPWLSAADALRESWTGQAELADWGLVCVPWLLLAGGAWALRRRAPRAAVAGLLALGVGGAAADDAQLVFAGWSRTGEPTPVWLEADPGAEGSPGVKVASARALRLVQGGAFWLAGPPAPSALVRVEVGRETETGWEGRALAESLRGVPMGELLIGSLGGAPPPGVLPSGPQVRLRARDVQLLAQAGQALDLLCIAPGVAQESWTGPLSAWAACGGTLVLTDAADAARFGLPPAAGARAFGAGWLVCAPPGEPLRGAARDALSARLAGRARRAATFESLHGRPSPPLPAEASGWLVWVSLAWIVVVLALARWRRGLPWFACASLLALVGIGLGGARYAGPRVLSAQVLEVCAGGEVARRLELLTLFAPRANRATLEFEGASPPWPLHDRGVDAWRASLAIEQRPGSSRVTCQASPEGTSLARLDAVRLEGPISVTRGSGGNRLKLANQSELNLERVFVLFRGAAYEVGELSSGRQVEFDVQQAGQRFDRWRLRSLAPREAALMRAVVYGRQLDRQLVVVGWTRGSEPSAAPQAAWTVQEPTLVLVRAVGP